MKNIFHNLTYTYNRKVEFPTILQDEVWICYCTKIKHFSVIFISKRDISYTSTVIYAKCSAAKELIKLPSSRIPHGTSTYV